MEINAGCRKCALAHLTRTKPLNNGVHMIKPKIVLNGITSITAKEYDSVSISCKAAIMSLAWCNIEPTNLVKLDSTIRYLLGHPIIEKALGKYVRTAIKQLIQDGNPIEKCELNYTPDFLECAPSIKILMEVHGQLCSLIHACNPQQMVDYLAENGRVDITVAHIDALIQGLSNSNFPAYLDFYQAQYQQLKDELVLA